MNSLMNLCFEYIVSFSSGHEDNMKTLGIDIGGTGIKAALVEDGELVTERFRIDTPQPATPQAVAQTVQTVCSIFNGLVPSDVPSPLSFKTV